MAENCHDVLALVAGLLLLLSPKKGSVRRCEVIGAGFSHGSWIIAVQIGGPPTRLVLEVDSAHTQRVGRALISAVKAATKTTATW